MKHPVEGKARTRKPAERCAGKCRHRYCAGYDDGYSDGQVDAEVPPTAKALVDARRYAVTMGLQRDAALAKLAELRRSLRDTRGAK